MSPIPKIIIVVTDFIVLALAKYPRNFCLKKTVAISNSILKFPSLNVTKSPLQHGYLSCIAECLLKTRHGRVGENANIAIYNVFLPGLKPNSVVFLSFKWLWKQQEIKWRLEATLSWSSPSPLRMLCLASTFEYLSANVAITDFYQYSLWIQLKYVSSAPAGLRE